MLLLLGGARSGKSRLAVSLASAHGAVTFLATGGAGDAEMAQRIERHRAERPPGWSTVEEPLLLERAIAAVPEERCLLIDCLSFWVANLLAVSSPEDVEQAALGAARAAAGRAGPTIAVSNEVGMGVVPVSPLGRAYRDLLGRVNAGWAELSEQAALVVAGQALPLRPPREAGLAL